MSEKPILFSAPMVRAILNNKKSMTRRAVNFSTLRVVPRSDVHSYFPFYGWYAKKGKKYKCQMNQNGAVSAILPDGKLLGLKPGEFDFTCPYCTGKTILDQHGRWQVIPEAGSKMWVKETWAPKYLAPDRIYYRADNNPTDMVREDAKWIPSIHMPRRVSRITLDVASIRIEHLQDISNHDAVAEGIISFKHHWRSEEYPMGDMAYKSSASAEYIYSDAKDAFQELWEAINGAESWNSNPWVWVVEFKKMEASK